VLGNLIKNGLEAGGSGNWVTVGCCDEGDAVAFTVSNPAVMPEDTQLQLFNRRFSTKGKDRGLGTYSVKLLTEAYLGGTVSFVSRESEGTVFTLHIPKEPPQRHHERGDTDA
jgi:sensor histidine kinase regulating citrate/malate metabolism